MRAKITRIKNAFPATINLKCVSIISRVINEKGYVADCRRQSDGSFHLTQRNCPTEAIAVAYPQVCEQELRIYREVLGCEVIRECRISMGAQTCGYRIVPANKLSLRVLPNR